MSPSTKVAPCPNQFLVFPRSMQLRILGDPVSAPERAAKKMQSGAVTFVPQNFPGETNRYIEFS